MADVLYHFHFHFQNYALHEKGFPHIHQPTHFHPIIIFAITPNSASYISFIYIMKTLQTITDSNVINVIKNCIMYTHR